MCVQKGNCSNKKALQYDESLENFPHDSRGFSLFTYIRTTTTTLLRPLKGPMKNAPRTILYEDVVQ